MPARCPHVIVTICNEEWHLIGGLDTEVHFINPAQMTRLEQSSDSYPPEAELNDQDEAQFRLCLDVVLDYAIQHGLLDSITTRDRITWRKK